MSEFKFYYFTKDGKIDRSKGWCVDEASAKKLLEFFKEDYPDFKWGYVYV